MALQGNLRDLARINRWLGGVRLSASAIDTLARTRLSLAPARDRTVLSVLDVGTGGADIPLALLDRARRRRERWTLTAIDSRPEVLAAALAADPRVGATDGLDLQLGDGRSLPYPDRSFDVAHTSLVLHHLEPTAAVVLLAEMARVARLGIVVNDLARGWLPWAGAWLIGHLLTTDRYTRHDAPLSVRRAYSRAEAVDLLSRAGLRVAHIHVGLFGHRWAIAATRAAGLTAPDRPNVV